MQRLRSSGTSIFGSMAVPRLKKKALDSFSAVQDTFFSTKDIFERHKVVFTISTSIASVGTAWIGEFFWNSSSICGVSKLCTESLWNASYF